MLLYIKFHCYWWSRPVPGGRVGFSLPSHAPGSRCRGLCTCGGKYWINSSVSEYHRIRCVVTLSCPVGLIHCLENLEEEARKLTSPNQPVRLHLVKLKHDHRKHLQ